MSKFNKMMKKGKKAGLSNIDMLRMIQVADERAKEAERIGCEKAFIYMLVIPLSILANDYWSKTAKRKIPEFIEKTMSLFDSLEKGVVEHAEMIELLEEYAGVKIDVEWAKKREKEV